MRKILTLTVLILGILTFTSLWTAAAPGPSIVNTHWTGCNNPYVGPYGFDNTCVCLSVDSQQGSLFVGTLFTVDGPETIYGNIDYKPGVLTLNFVSSGTLRGPLSVSVAANGAFGLMKGTLSRGFNFFGQFSLEFCNVTLKLGGTESCGNGIE